MKTITNTDELRSFLIYECQVSKINADDIINRWNEPWRSYHGISHLFKSLSLLETNYSNISQNDLFALRVAIIFHDVVYLPYRDDNEIESCRLMYKYCEYLPTLALENIDNLIMQSKHNEKPTENNINIIFWEIDNNILLNPEPESLLEYERAIRMEYPDTHDTLYIYSRIKFLNDWSYENVKFISSEQFKIIRIFIMDLPGLYKTI